jgi:hypothetical protein
MAGISFAKTVSDCELLKDALEPHLTDMPHLAGERDELVAFLTEVKSLNARQKAGPGPPEPGCLADPWQARFQKRKPSRVRHHAAPQVAPEEDRRGADRQARSDRARDSRSAVANRMAIPWGGPWPPLFLM